MDLRRTSAPLTIEQKKLVVSLDDVKAQARVTSSAEDSLISGYIETAYDFLSGIDGWLGGCCLLEETWDAYFPTRVGRSIEVPLRPLVEVISFDSLQGGAAYLSIDPNLYVPVTNGYPFASIERAPSRMWPYTGEFHPRAYRMTFKVGFGAADAVPTPIKQGIKMLAAHWLRQRETAGQVQGEVLYGLKSLCGRYRVGPDHS